MGRPRLALAFACAAGLAAPVACVDLFHSTDFETLKDAAPGADVDVDGGDRDATKPLVDFCAWSPAEAKAHATRACAWLGACGGPTGESVFGPCMLHALWAYDCDLNPTMRPNGASRALWSCLSDVKSCAEVDACVFAGSQPTCAAVAAGSFTQCGTGGASDTRVECGKPEAGPPSAVDPCILQGKSCIALDDSTSLCSGATKKSCAAGVRCEGTAAVDCRTMTTPEATLLVDEGIDCASFGEGACASDDAGRVACLPQSDAGACDAGPEVSCGDGGIATSCVAGRALAIDCAKLGLGCDVSKTVPAYEPLRACAENQDAGRCVSADECRDGKLRSCAQGAAFEADCASLGLGACERIGSGALAHCTKP